MMISIAAGIVIIIAVLVGNATSYETGRLDGYNQAQKDFLKMLDDLEKKRRLEMLSGRIQTQEEI